MSLFTLTFDFGDGGYITQVRSGSFRLGALECLKQWNTEKSADNFTEVEKKEILEKFDPESIFELQDFKNIWCFPIQLRGKTVVAKLVQTFDT